MYKVYKFEAEKCPDHRHRTNHPSMASTPHDTVDGIMAKWKPPFDAMTDNDRTRRDKNRG